MKSLNIKKKAIKYRRQGYSYGMISEKLGLAKSTLSDWLRDIPYKPSKEVIKRIKLAHLRAGQAKHEQRMADIERIKKLSKQELGKLNKRDIWLLGIGLYLGDGKKSQEKVQVINSDPEIIKIAIKWLREICGLNTENFTIAIHLYPDNNIRKTVNFWSQLTGIPKQQFTKTQIDRRINKSSRKKRKLPYGTAHLTVRASGRKEFGRNLHRRIMGWIEAIITQVNMRE